MINQLIINLNKKYIYIYSLLSTVSIHSIDQFHLYLKLFLTSSRDNSLPIVYHHRLPRSNHSFLRSHLGENGRSKSIFRAINHPRYPPIYLSPTCNTESGQVWLIGWPRNRGPNRSLTGLDPETDRLAAATTVLSPPSPKIQFLYRVTIRSAGLIGSRLA